jgi:hypothetical protein
MKLTLKESLKQKNRLLGILPVVRQNLEAVGTNLTARCITVE